MTWGFLGPLRFRTKAGGQVTIFGAWFVAPISLAWYLSNSSGLETRPASRDSYSQEAFEEEHKLSEDKPE